ncbi:hypothetical protein KGM_201604 [Danaus plexippus plexippus]|uniref:Uncharacterized protein n=1 Tax=Danaus plexippus plexippus TaxID=278856 RepID=A0A212FFH2_DANPL|nr:hypothetical protein KGM_201604 [Danaus plexippus plexippus]
MWRSRSSLEEWERRKTYLIRSLFEDLPALSPIYEQHEPISPSSPSYFIRAESPLPDLIIEIEPRKPNLHDDPDEVYEELAKEMRRLYKRDFLGVASRTSSSEVEEFDDNSPTGTYDSSSGQPESEDELKEDNQSIIISQNDQIDTQIQNSSHESSDAEIVSETVLAEVEIHPRNDENEQGRYIPFRLFQSLQPIPEFDERSLNVSKTTLVIESMDEQEGDIGVEEASVTKSFAKDSDASSKHSSSQGSLNHSFGSPDIIRQGEPFTSLGTPVDPKQTASIIRETKRTDFSLELKSEEYSGDVLPSDRELELAESTASDENLLYLTSTPRRKRKSEKPVYTREREHKRRSLSISSPISEASAANAAMQTSFSDGDPDWTFFWSNFFVGAPTVYNICSCDNHVCS